jgi:hypothetical protein
MYPADSINFNQLFLAAPAYSYYGIEAVVTLPNATGKTFLTKSIDTSYAAKTCFFDFAMDFEYTPG